MLYFIIVFNPISFTLGGVDKKTFYIKYLLTGAAS